MILTNYVERMFPISFARQDIYGARSLSESNLISWLQHFSPDSATPHTFMITESIPNVFGLPDRESSKMYLEFIIGGYYVKFSDRYFTSEIEGFTTEGTKTTHYYASINFSNNGNDECFRTLDGGESPSGANVEFTALKIYEVVNEGSIPEEVTNSAYFLHLFSLKQTNTGSGDEQTKNLEYIIPRTSLRTIDGGEI